MTPRAPHAAGDDRVHDGALGRDHPDRAHVALAVRDVGARDAADRAVAGRVDEAERAVEARVDLLARPGEVDLELVAADREGEADRDRLGIVPEAVDVVDSLVPPVRERRDLGTHRALRGVLKALEVGADVASVPLDELREPALAGAAGGDLRLEVAEHLGRLPGVLLDDAEEGLVLDPAVVELEERQAKALLEDLGRVDGDAPGRDAADVGMVGERRGVPLELVVDEDRLDHVDVGQVLPAVAVRVVGDEDVSRTASSSACSSQRWRIIVGKLPSCTASVRPCATMRPWRSQRAVE